MDDHKIGDSESIESKIRIRISVFSDKPNFILVFAPDNTEVLLPILSSPFTKDDVERRCRKSGINASVRITGDRRWQQEMKVQLNNEKSVKIKTQKERELVKATRMVFTGTDDLHRERGEVILLKQRIEEEMEKVQNDINNAKKNRMLHGIFLPKGVFIGMTDKLSSLKKEKLAIDLRLGEIKKKIREMNVKKSLNFQDMFLFHAKQILSPDVYSEIEEKARLDCGGFSYTPNKLEFELDEEYEDETGTETDNLL